MAVRQRGWQGRGSQVSRRAVGEDLLHGVLCSRLQILYLPLPLPLVRLVSFPLLFSVFCCHDILTRICILYLI
jgi:hypothetical protein